MIKAVSGVCSFRSKSTPNLLNENLSHALADLIRSIVSVNLLILRVLGLLLCFSSNSRANRLETTGQQNKNTTGVKDDVFALGYGVVRVGVILGVRVSRVVKGID